MYIFKIGTYTIYHLALEHEDIDCDRYLRL